MDPFKVGDKVRVRLGGYDAVVVNVFMDEKVGLVVVVRYEEKPGSFKVTLSYEGGASHLSYLEKHSDG